MKTWWLSGPMKGVIPTPYIAKIFHPTPDIEGKKCLTPDIQNLPWHSTPNLKNVKIEWLYQVDTRSCDFQVDTQNYKIFDLDTWHWPPFQGPCYRTRQAKCVSGSTYGLAWHTFCPGSSDNHKFFSSLPGFIYFLRVQWVCFAKDQQGNTC